MGIFSGFGLNGLYLFWWRCFSMLHGNNIYIYIYGGLAQCHVRIIFILIPFVVLIF